MIKPIETVYKGYRFRSRLEARWAVFFDSLGLHWEYEKEGFDLNGKYYLPDFYLPHLDLWVEIKPGDPDNWPEDHCVFDYLENLLESDEDEEYNNSPIRNFIILVGVPGEGPQDTSDSWPYCGYIPGDCYYRWCECPVCGKIGIEYDGRAARICGQKCLPNSDKSYNTHSPRLLSAYHRARGARFEHGEKG